MQSLSALTRLSSLNSRFRPLKSSTNNGSIFPHSSKLKVHRGNVVSGSVTQSRSSQLRGFLSFSSSKMTTSQYLKNVLARRNYSSAMGGDRPVRASRHGYTEEQIMNDTIEANGFRVLSDSDEAVDVSKWETVVTRAFNELRFSDVLTAYGNIKGLGPNRSAMADLNVRALDYLGSREEEILDHYQEMKNLGIPILSESYAKIIKAYMRLDSPKRALSVFQEMRDNGIAGTPEVYNVLLGLYFKDDPQDISTVRGILDMMKKTGVEPDQTTLDRLMLAYCEVGNTELIKKTYQELVAEKGIQPKRITCSIMAETLILEGNYETAAKFLQRMAHMGTFPRLRTYELFLEYFLTNGKKKKADDLLEELMMDAKLKPTLTIFKSFIKYHHERDDYLGLQGTLSMMITEKICPDFETMETLLDVYYHAHRDDDFFATFVEMLDRQMVPARHFWSRRIQLMAQSKFDDFTTLMREYEYMLQAGMEPTEADLRLILNSFFDQDRLDLAHEFAQQEMSQFGVSLDLTDYTRFLQGYIKARVDSAIIKTWEELQTLKASNPAFVHSEPSVLMVRGYLQMEKPDEAIQLFNNLVDEVKNKVVTLDHLQAPRLMETFAALGKDGSPFLQQVYDLTATSCPEAITIDLFDVYIKFLSQHNIESAFAHFKTMQENYKIPPTATLYNELLEGFARDTEKIQSLRHFSSVVELFKTALFDPAFIQFPTQIASTFFLFLLRHGSDEIFSQAIAWYKDIHTLNKEILDFEKAVAMRKWISLLSTDQMIPKQYKPRNLDALAANVFTPKKNVLEMS